LVLLFALLNHNIYVTKEITTKSSHILIICLLSHALSSYTFLSKCWNFDLFNVNTMHSEFSKAKYFALNRTTSNRTLQHIPCI
jgi:hypothetical protein